jgi:sulfur carrier protein ThiS
LFDCVALKTDKPRGRSVDRPFFGSTKGRRSYADRPVHAEHPAARRLPAGAGGRGTVRPALEAVFAGNPAARSYVLDDQGLLRRHMIVFVDGEVVRDRDRLTDPVGDASAIDVFHALSGG